MGQRPKDPLRNEEEDYLDSLWDKMILKDQLTTNQGYVSATPQDGLVGRTGKTVTDLRPAVTAWIEGRPVDVVAEGVFLKKGEMVRVIAVEGMRVVVRRVEEN